jgi:hypothetical protein
MDRVFGAKHSIADRLGLGFILFAIELSEKSWIVGAISQYTDQRPVQDSPSPILYSFRMARMSASPSVFAAASPARNRAGLRSPGTNYVFDADSACVEFGERLVEFSG